MIVEYIVEFQWSPEQIVGRLPYDTGEKKISFPTIHRGIALDNLGVPLTSHGARAISCQLRHHSKKRRGKGTVNELQGKFHDVRAIERPAGTQNRTRFGHWEGDTGRGKTGGAAVVTLVDRKARYMLLGKVAKVTADNVRDCLIALLSTVTTKASDKATLFQGSASSTFTHGYVPLSVWSSQDDVTANPRKVWNSVGGTYSGGGSFSTVVANSGSDSDFSTRMNTNQALSNLSRMTANTSSAIVQNIPIIATQIASLTDADKYIFFPVLVPAENNQFRPAYDNEVYATIKLVQKDGSVR